MKKHTLLTILLVLALAAGSIAAAQAEILPPYGEGQIGLTSVVLCESLTLHENPDASSGTVWVLPYGSLINVTEQSNGWAYCVIGDSEDAAAGWVNASYIAVDPSWYVTGSATPVYAWNDTAAPKVGLLEKDLRLPVLKIDGDWIVVSLRGAAGWIYTGAAN